MKKIIATLLVLTMMLSMLVIGTSAAAWDGTSASASLKGEGTADNPYLVETAEDLKYIQVQVNEGNKFEGKYFKQTADIDLGNKEWTPIGERTAKPFIGLYDGNGYKIVNFYQTFQYRFGGLFAYMKQVDGFTPGLINITLEGKMDTVTRKGDIYAGALLGWTDQSKTGSALNDNKVLVANCVTDVDMNFDSTGVGITASCIIAPVFSRTGSVIVSNCVNNGDINVVADGHQITVGGVVAYLVDGDLINCVNNGKITISGPTLDIYAGGVVGAVATSLGVCKVENSINNGEVNTAGGGAGYVGGVVGCVSSAVGVAINNCANVASVTSKSVSDAKLPYAGGVLGYTARPKVVVSNSYNSGAIATANDNKTGHAPGGIAGVLNNSEATTYIEKCVTTTDTFKGWFNAANEAKDCTTGADASVVANAAKAIKATVDGTKSATVNGATFAFVYPAAPETPVEPSVPTGDAAIVFVMIALVSLAGVVVTKKVTSR